MKYVIKVCNADEYLIVTFSPMEAVRTYDIKKATSWECRDCAEIVASEFCGVKVIDAEETENKELFCPFCKGKLLEIAIRNPFGLSKLNTYVCHKCHLVGSKGLWEKLK